MIVEKRERLRGKKKYIRPESKKRDKQTNEGNEMASQLAEIKLQRAPVLCSLSVP